MSKFVTEITDAQFKKEIESSKIPVMVDFWALWCGPCKMTGPIVEEVAGGYNGRIKIVKINVDDNQNTATELGIMTIPTFVFFKDNKEILRFSGALSKKELIKKIDSVID